MVALIVALLIACACGTAKGQQVNEVPAEPLPSMLQQPAYAAPVFDESPEPFHDIACADECVECGPMCVQESYWYAGVDVLATRFSYHADSISYFDYRYSSNDEASVAVRPYLGWESRSGIGIRTRLWLFHGEVKAAIEPSFISYYWWIEDYVWSVDSEFDISLSANYLDLDVYRRFYYDRTSFVLGVGSKAASIEAEYDSYFKEQYGAGGISAFVEGHHPLYLGPKVECAFIGYGRIGLLTGELETRSGSIQTGEFDLSMSITEVGMGLELKRKFRRGNFLFQVVSEIQSWETQGKTAVDLSFDALGLRFGGQW